ncbi:MAG TPA: BTAD domain-containing putative transcriptional regulator, partial [Microlunatus sp.]|nr:BTAD domain-containing putative transcriptional regulator [Microlunatus sp.]
WLPQPIGLEPGRPPAAERDLQLSVELRLVTRSLRSPIGTRGLAAGLARLLAGDLSGAVRAVEWVRDDASRWEQLAARLVGQLAELVDRPDQDAAGRLEEIVLAADVDAFPWLSRVARGVQAALWLALRPSDWRVAACADLIEDCVRHRDEWATCLLTGLVGAAHAVGGRGELAMPLLRRCAESAHRLSAPVLQLWAEALQIAVSAGSSEFGPASTADTARVTRSADLLGVDAVVRIVTALRPSEDSPLARWAATPRDATPRDPGPHDAAPRDAGQVDASPVDASGPREHRAADAERPSDAAGGGLDSSRRAGRAATQIDPSKHPAARLDCLGGFALTVDGAAVGWSGLRPRARVLLMLLASRSGQAIHREALIEAIWPEASLTSGTRSLQVAVSSVRQWLAAAGLGEDSLRRHGDAYGLFLPQVVVDVRRFEEQARLADQAPAGAERLAALSAALDAYGGELLPEVGPAEWVLAERDRLRALAARLGVDAAQTALELENWSAGIAAARRSIELDPYHDSAWQLLAELLDRAGDHSAAAVARREHARVCAELGVPVP